MISRWVLALLGLFHLVNGFSMLLAPDAWYAAVPGVAQTGPINHHFIADIALAFLASGGGMLFALRAGRAAASFALAGSVWPALHALFHIWGWIADHAPRTPQMWLSEALGVVFVGLLGVTLAAMRFRQGDTRC
ncbi:MAG TPA: hypothetical protein VMH86_08665 [Rhizomicrobium sp.]|nr:hypothetical protein [Rhizomicrobium sp.]